MKTSQSLSLLDDGVCYKSSFLSRKAVDTLNQELDLLFNNPSINGGLGGVFLNLSPRFKKIMLPTLAIRSTNLLELALDVRDVLLDQVSNHPDDRSNKFFVTDIAVFEEQSAKPLFWHTDNRRGTYRAFIYLEGGRSDSGALRYVVRTHLTDYQGTHKIDDPWIDARKGDAIDLVGNPGDLLIVDINGVHANCPRHNRRRILVFEYQDQSVHTFKATIVIPHFHFSTKVRENIASFLHDGGIKPFTHGCDTYFFAPPDLPLSVAARLFFNSMLVMLRNRLGQCKRAIRAFAS